MWPLCPRSAVAGQLETRVCARCAHCADLRDPDAPGTVTGAKGWCSPRCTHCTWTTTGWQVCSRSAWATRAACAPCSCSTTSSTLWQVIPRHSASQCRAMWCWRDLLTWRPWSCRSRKRPFEGARSGRQPPERARAPGGGSGGPPGPRTRSPPRRQPRAWAAWPRLSHPRRQSDTTVPREEQACGRDICMEPHREPLLG